MTKITKLLNFSITEDIEGFPVPILGFAIAMCLWISQKQLGERENPTGKAYDVVRYWDDCDRTVLNKEPLTYQGAKELYEQEFRSARYGSLYSWTVEIHK